MRETIFAEGNPDFSSDREIVIRKSEYRDSRTFAIRANKAAIDLPRGFVNSIKARDREFKIILESRS